jgi:hypothetical protein
MACAAVPRSADERAEQTSKARRTYRDSFPSEAAYREHMRTIAQKSARARREKRLAKRKAAAEALHARMYAGREAA